MCRGVLYICCDATKRTQYAKVCMMSSVCQSQCHHLNMLAGPQSWFAAQLRWRHQTAALCSNLRHLAYACKMTVINSTQMHQQPTGGYDIPEWCTSTAQQKAYLRPAAPVSVSVSCREQVGHSRVGTPDMLATPWRNCASGALCTCQVCPVIAISCHTTCTGSKLRQACSS